MNMDSLLDGEYTAETTEDYGEDICNLPYPGDWPRREEGNRKSS